MRTSIFFERRMRRGGGGGLEGLTFWKNEPSHYKRFGGFQKWLENRDNDQIKETIKKLENLKTIPVFEIKNNEKEWHLRKSFFQKNILDFAKKYPQTQFHLIIPTYSRLYYVLDNKAGEFAYFIKWLVLETNNLKNVKIYGFDEGDYADDIANYKDLTHYHFKMNSIQLSAIQNKSNVLTPQNIDAYLKTMQEKIKNYDIKPFLKMAGNKNF